MSKKANERIPMQMGKETELTECKKRVPFLCLSSDSLHCNKTSPRFFSRFLTTACFLASNIATTSRTSVHYHKRISSEKSGADDEERSRKEFFHRGPLFNRAKSSPIFGRGHRISKPPPPPVAPFPHKAGWLFECL